MAQEFFFKKKFTLLDLVKSNIENRISVYVYNNVISLITHKVIKKFLEYNIIQYIFVNIGWEYKILFVVLLFL